MKFTESIRITSHHTMSIGQFLSRHDLVGRFTEVESAIDWLAGEFLPEAGINESYEDWVARQVGQILATNLLCDTMAGSAHVARKVSHIELDDLDKRYLFNTLGQHPEVRRIWGSLIELPEAFGIAA